MKKIRMILLLSAIAIFSVNAQGQIANGNSQLNAGVGFSDWGTPVYVGLDFGIRHDISLGIEGSFRSYNENISGKKYGNAIYGFSGNANLHFNRLLNIQNRWDFYAGLNLGFYAWETPSDYPNNGHSGLGWGGQVGVRYYFSNRFGLNLEYGGGNAFSGGKFGISYIF